MRSWSKEEENEKIDEMVENDCKHSLWLLILILVILVVLGLGYYIVNYIGTLPTINDSDLKVFSFADIV